VSDTDYFPRGSIIRRVNIEPAILFGAGRALMLQIAHEAVAQGVEEHSDFKGNPFKRLLGTLEAMYAVVYGSEDLARGVGRRIQWIHTFVVGPTYSANDPANLMWVHATLADTALRCYKDYIGPLSTADEETYYEEMTRVAELFGVPRDKQPATIADFHAYVDEMVATIDVTPIGKDLATFILNPTLPLGLHLPLKPLLAAQRMFTLGSLPAPIRDQLGAKWDARSQARYDRAQRWVRRWFSLSPRGVRTAGPRLNGLFLLWLARRHVRQFDERQRSKAYLSSAQSNS
jgi:uncharacterized protein (DUF2236 family)